jgi:hypothetical protein
MVGTPEYPSNSRLCFSLGEFLAAWDNGEGVQDPVQLILSRVPATEPSARFESESCIIRRSLNGEVSDAS